MENKTIAKMKTKPTGIDILAGIEKRKYFSFDEFYNYLSQDSDISYKALNKRFNRLVRAGYVDKNKYPLSKEFELSEAGKRFLLNNRGLGEKISCRTHDLLFKAKIIHRPECTFKNGFEVNTCIKNWRYPQYYTTLKNGIHIQISDESVTVRIKEINDFDSDVAIMAALEKVVEILADLMTKYKPLQLGYPERVVDIITQHHAINNKQIREFIQEFQIKYKDDRIQVDCSKGVPEIEFIHPVHAQGDFRKVIDFLRLLAENKLDLDGLLKDYGRNGRKDTENYKNHDVETLSQKN